MRHFLIILLGLIPFLSPAQNVCLKPSTARWFLEQSDRAVTLAKKDSLSQQTIFNLNQIISTKDQIILTYQSDSTTYNQILATKNQELEFKDKQLKYAQKEIKRQKFHKVLLGVGTVLVAILAASNL